MQLISGSRVVPAIPASERSMCSLALDYLPEMTPLNEHFAAQDGKISRGADTRVHP